MFPGKDCGEAFSLLEQFHIYPFSTLLSVSFASLRFVLFVLSVLSVLFVFFVLFVLFVLALSHLSPVPCMNCLLLFMKEETTQK